MSITFLTDANEEMDFGVSCQNLVSLLELLQIEFDYCGAISAGPLLQKIDTARRIMDARGREFVRFPRIIVGSNGARVIDSGLKSKHIGFYLDRLEGLARVAQATGFDQVKWG
jgi:hypothetical protein